MTKSRSRRRTSRGPDRLRARRNRDRRVARTSDPAVSTPAPGAAVGTPAAATDRHFPLRHFLATISFEDRVKMGRCMKAQAAGDVGTAIGNYVWGPYPEAAYEAFDLIELSQLGDDSPPWAYSRWIGRQSQRWLAAVADPRVRECAAEAFATTHEDFSVLDPPWLPPFDPDSFDDGEDEDEEDSLEWAREVMSREFVANWLAFQLCVYELGGMRDFLEREASDALIEASDLPYQWADAKLGVYIYGWRQGDTLSVYDLQNKQERTVLHLGASSDVPECTIVLGRLVPITQEPGLMFESRPLVIDPETARGIVGLSAVSGSWTTAVPRRAMIVVSPSAPSWLAPVSTTPMASSLYE